MPMNRTQVNVCNSGPSGCSWRPCSSPDLSFLPRPAMVWCERGIQVLLTTMGAFAAFALMTVAIGTDYWLYARAFICNSTANSSQDDSNNMDKKDPGALTHSGLWRICCLEGKAAPPTRYVM